MVTIYNVYTVQRYGIPVDCARKNVFFVSIVMKKILTGDLSQGQTEDRLNCKLNVECLHLLRGVFGITPWSVSHQPVPFAPSCPPKKHAAKIKNTLHSTPACLINEFSASNRV